MALQDEWNNSFATLGIVLEFAQVELMVRVAARAEEARAK